MGNILDSVISTPCHPKNRGGTRPVSAIKYLVYHYTGNDGDTGANNARYYRDNVVQASAHYFVDDDGITQAVEDNGIAWAVGGKKWADCAKTGGGTLFLKATNYNSLSIELCDARRDGQVMATEATLARGAELGRALMAKYGISIERVIRHFDVSGKHCPAYFMDAAAWEAFKGRLAGKEETGMKLYKYVNDLPYGQEAVTRAIQSGYIKLDNSGAMGLWEPNLQTVILMDRAGMFDKPAISGR